MKNIPKKIIVCSAIASLLTSSSAYSFSGYSDALRSMASVHARTGDNIAQRLDPDTEFSLVDKGDIDPITRSAIEAQFNDFLKLIDSDTTNNAKRLEAIIKLSRNDFTSFEFAMMLEYLRRQVRERCGKNIDVGVLKVTKDIKTEIHVGISVQYDNAITANKTSSGGINKQDTVEISPISKLLTQFIHEQDPDVLRSLIHTAEKAMNEPDANTDKKEILGNVILAAKMRLLCKFPLQSTQGQRELVFKLKMLESQWQEVFERLLLQAGKVSRIHYPDQHASLQYKLKMYEWFLTTLQQDIAELEGRLSQSFPRNLVEKSSSSGVFDAAGGFTFFKWSKKPGILASGKYGNLKIKSGKLEDKTLARFDSELKKVKSRLLREGFFNKEDFNVAVEVIYPAYKAATYLKKRDTIILDRRSFDNDDFLYFKVKHELSDRKLPEMDIIGEHFKELPGLRELFTLITVDIKGFMYLRDHYPSRAKDMLKYCRYADNHSRGLSKCYEKIMKNPSIIDPFDLTEDVFRLVESEKLKVYFPNTRKAVRKIASKNSDGSINYKTTAVILRGWLKSIQRQLLELQDIREISRFKPLTDFNKNTPSSLIPFIPYAKDIDYQLDNDCIFLRVKLNNNQNKARFAYLYIGLNDDWGSILGKHGKIYSLAYHKWQHASLGIFQYMHDGIEKERDLYWNYLIRLPITKLIDSLSGNSSQNSLRKLFLDTFDELEIKGHMDKKTWFSVKKIVGQKQAPNKYYAIRGIIWRHIDCVYPKLFLGEKNLRGMSIGDIPAWLIMGDSEIGSNALSFLNPRKKQEPTSFYEQADKVSMKDIIKMLQEADSYRVAPFQPMRQMNLFDEGQTVSVPILIHSISNIYNMQQVKSAISSAA